MLLESKDYKQIVEGSFEQKIHMLEAALEAEIGEVTIIATFSDRIVFGHDDHVYEGKYSIRGGRIKIKNKLREDVTCYNEKNSKRVVSQLLHGIFDEKMNEEEKRNRLRVLTHLVSADEDYNIVPHLELLLGLTEGKSSWELYYIEHEDNIRRSLFGKVNKLDAFIPSRLRPVAKTKVTEDTVSVVEKTLDKLVAVVQNVKVIPCVEDEDDDEGLAEVYASLGTDVSKCLVSLQEVRSLISLHNVLDVMPVLNSLHDYFRTMVRVSSFLSQGQKE